VDAATAPTEVGQPTRPTGVATPTPNTEDEEPGEPATKEAEQVSAEQQGTTRDSTRRPPSSLGFEIVIGTSVITGATLDAVVAERERQRRLLAFLYSTPAYAPTLELYGWTDVGPRLRELIRHDRWDDLAAVLPDEVLDTLVPSGTFDELPGLLHDRFTGLGQGIVVSPPPDGRHDEAFRSVVAALQAA